MTRTLLSLVICAVSTSANAQTVPFPPPPPTPEPGCDVLPQTLEYGDYRPALDGPLEPDLQALLTERMGPGFASAALTRARQRADSTLLPLLYEIVDRAACHVPPDNLLLALEASGAPSAYFLGLPDRYPGVFADEFGVYHVLNALGVRGDTLVAETVFDRYGGPEPDGSFPGGGSDLGGAVDYARRIRHDRRLADLTPEDQARWLVADVAARAISQYTELPDDEAVEARIVRTEGFPEGSIDNYKEAWARRRLIALSREFPAVVEAVLPSVIDSLVAVAQTPPTPEEAADLEFFGFEWYPPPPAALVAGRAAARETVKATATVFEPPAPYAPGPGPVAPQCDGREATVYVAPDGTIVGGPDDGQPYAGTLRGTTGPDMIVGTPAPDTLRGSAGDDVLCGLGGDDELRGDHGEDTVYGGPGDDDLLLGAGDDRAYGGSGNDFVRGAAGDDTAWGEAGNDRLLGNDGRDTLWGGDGDDALEGGSGDDELRGEAGTDDARGGSGRDACDAETETSCETDPDGS